MSRSGAAQRDAAHRTQNQKRKPRSHGSKARESLERASEKDAQGARATSRSRSARPGRARRAAQDLVSFQRSAEQNLKTGEPAHSRALADRLSEARHASPLVFTSAVRPRSSSRAPQALVRRSTALAAGRELAAGTGPRRRDRTTCERNAQEAVLELRDAESSMGEGGTWPTRGRARSQQNMSARRSQEAQPRSKIGATGERCMLLSSVDRGELERMAESRLASANALEEVRGPRRSPKAARPSRPDAARKCRKRNR